MKLYVLTENDAVARAATAAGATPVPSLDDVVEPLARGATGAETLAQVRALVAEGKAPVAMGGLDRATLARCREAGAVGFVLREALWLLPEAQTPETDREALGKLTARSFAAARDVALPSGARVGRDALLAPHVARRSPTLRQALADVAADAARAVAPELPPRVATAAATPTGAQDGARAAQTAAPARTPIQRPNAVSAAAPADWPFETRPHEEAVAIVGVGCVLPGASTPDKFWQNVLDKRDAIVEVPADRWDVNVHYDADASKPDKTYSKIGAFVTDFTFDPMRFRIPPRSAAALDEVQQWVLTAASDALADAGYEKKEFDRARCAVILGNSLGGEKKDLTTKRMHVAEFAAHLQRTASTPEEKARVEQWAREALAQLPTITEDTMPGELSNVIAGRVANVLNLSGKNLTTDAACASSHAALDTAVKAILGGEADMVLCGGADRSMDPATYVKFSKIGALSATGSRPFDARADGFVMGEGAAMLVLKRLSDAVRDGDRIYAVVRGMGSSSDGKGKGITAPNPTGQRLAVERALKVADVQAKHVQLVEAHGTSTKVGDVVEVESISALYADVPRRSVALGSVKSQIGHLKSAAGAAGMLKAALALHHKVLPPSANFETPNPNVDWENVPFYVNTEAKPWPRPANGEPRRAAVSSFGFGGTNFHVVLEEFVPEYHAYKNHNPASAPEGSPMPAARPEVEAELVVLGAATPAALAAAARAAAQTPPAATLAQTAARMRMPDAHAAAHRLALGAGDHPTLVRALEGAATLVADDRMRAALPIKVKGAAYGTGPRVPGKVAFLFPGQGSQYVNMMSDLARRYPVVKATFDEADRVLEPLLGRKLTQLLFVDAKDEEAVKGANEALRQTEVTQPAMLAADVAMLRLLEEHHVRPDMVAGHSLGEYAALVAGGVLSFEDALLAVSARGKEMASVEVPDKGLMASFSCGPEQAEQILAQVDGYVVCANKNCPVQTVIAGATDAVQKAVALAQQHGVETMMLPVSAAFHTSIVAPASEPLRRVLERLDFRSPRIPVYTNVDAAPYPSEPDAIRDVLSKQVAAPVEWVAEMNALYDAGCRIFVEVGPKRALAGFVEATLAAKGDVHSVVTNHPKAGDLPSFFGAAAKLATMGFDLGLPTEAAAPAPAAAPLGAAPAPAARAAPPAAAAQAAPAPAPAPAQRPTLTASAGTDYDAFRAAVAPALEAALKTGYETFAAELARLKEAEQAFARFGLAPVDVVVSGAAMGLPGMSRRVFDDANFDRIFAGENRIDRLDAAWSQRFLDKEIVRLVKGEGEPRMEAVKDAAEVLKLAGRRGELDLAADYETDAKLLKTLDISSKLALAAAYEALRDAGIPLVREKTVMSNGKTRDGAWTLPPHLQNDTAVIFASAFPGYDNLVGEVSRHLAQRYAGATMRKLDALYHELLDVVPSERRGTLSAFYADHRSRLQDAVKDAGTLETFNRHFLFSVLSLGHAEVAETLHARGPNTQVNAACASTTQAIAIAEDWLRAGRAKRVLVLGADDVTSDNLLEWIGSGFLASGAATTAGNVEDGALPFDRRRHGMILGMGAVGLVIEAREDVEARGMTPIARLVATRIANSAYHGSRLDVNHLAKETRGLVETAAMRLGVPVESLGEKTLFVSHETYTPARGGSASAEAGALRAAFGSSAGKVLVTNTKGFTGHAMGASMEDAIALKALQFNRAPPIANLRDTDPEFADLNLSRGGTHDRRYAVRFSAGFGSQIAITFLEKMADGEQRIADAGRHQSFLDQCAGAQNAVAERVKRTLRITSATGPTVGAAPAMAASAPAPTPAPRVVPVKTAPAVATPPPAAGPSLGEPEILARVIELVASKTGYPKDVLDPTLDMEADLGIDTVKQAEVFGELREAFGVERDPNMKLKDVPTLGGVAKYLAARLPAAAPAAPAPAAAPTAAPAPAPAAVAVAAAAPAPAPAPAPEKAATPAPAAASQTGTPSSAEALDKVLDIIATRTGYPKDVLDPTLDMEADLGIDTVKQAEIFGEVRDTFSIPRLEGLKIKDYPTIAKVAQFVMENSGKAAAPAAPTPAQGEAAIDAPCPAQTLVRRAPRVREAPADASGEPKRGFVVGRGPLADALRHALPAKEGDVAVFVGTPRELFAYARSNAAKMERGELGVLAVTQMGGRHGIESAANWDDGGVTGMAKALAAEFPKAWVRALDLDPKEPLGARVAHVQAELRVPESPVEVGRTNAARVVVATRRLGTVGKERPDLPEGSVLVVTGGARGITAEILAALAPQKPTLVLLGRTAAPEPGDEVLDDATLDRLRAEAKAALEARGERATPVALERAVAPRKARAEVARTLTRLREAGASAEYVACDVVDAEALGRVLADVRARHGRIDGVLHAAGVEESKRLEDKDEAAFDRAWKPKAEAAGLLAKLTEGDALRFFVAFGSVAGRYGNAAQADYSAANDALSKLARVLRARGTPAAVMAWGPWGETGMATRGSTLKVLEMAGVEAMTTEEGVNAFLSELATLDEPEVVLAKSLGMLEKGMAQPTTATRTLTLRADDVPMDHHRVDGVPFLAGVMGLQAFADAAPFEARGFEDVHFAYPVKLLRDQPVEATVRVEDDGAATLTTVPPGPVPQPRTHFSARVVERTQAPPADAPAWTGASWSHDRIYPPFFHGPAFQVLARVERVGLDGLLVEGAQPTPGVPPMAATLEGALQSLGLWGLAVGGVMALPERVERIDAYGGFAPGETRYLVTGARVADGRVVGEVRCLRGEKIVAWLRGVRLIATGAAEVDAPPAPWRAEMVDVAGRAVSVVPVEDARALLARPELQARWLSEKEHATLSGFAVEKRREEWLAATLAAKSALRAAGDVRAWSAIEVLRGEDGAPLGHNGRGLTLSHAAGVAAAATFDEATERVGIDVERVEPRAATFEGEAFVDDERAAFPPLPEGDAGDASNASAERARVVTAAWTAKEAVLKALGTGLSVPLADVRVRVRLAEGQADVELLGAAKERFAELDGASLEVRLAQAEDRMLAAATLRRVERRR